MKYEEMIPFEKAYHLYKILTEETFRLLQKSKKLEDIEKQRQSERDIILLYSKHLLEENKGLTYYVRIIECIRDSFNKIKELEEEIKKLTDDNT